MTLSGFCLPEGPGGGADEARVRLLMAQRPAVEALLQEAAAAAGPEAAPALEQLSSTVAGLSPAGFLGAFDHPLLYPLARTGRDGAPGCAAAAALRAAGFLAGAPGVEALELELPAATPDLAFVHAGVRVRPCGLAATIRADGERLSVGWADRTAATFPIGRPFAAGQMSTPRFVRGGATQGLGWLNAVADAGALAFADPAAHEPTAAEVDALSEGVALLESVWPEAAASARRFFQAVLFLEPHPTHTRSMSAGQLQGAFIASMVDPVQVGDAICHEASHTRLNPLLELDPLLTNDPAAAHPSPWRPDPRPLIGVLHGVHAFLNVCHYYRRIADRLPEHATTAERIEAIQRARVEEGWSYLAARASPTSAGSELLSHLEREVNAL